MWTLLGLTANVSLANISLANVSQANVFLFEFNMKLSRVI